MNGRVWRAAAVAGLMTGGLYAAPASAQSTRTWVSGTGDDANPCSRTAPCKTFAGAISKTAAAGEINCIDPAGFGSVTITKAISIVCDTVEAGIVASGTSGITVSAGAADTVTLSGLDIDGIGGLGTNGIVFNSGAALILDNVKIRGFAGYGIRFAPTASASLTLRRSILSGNGAASATASGGLYVYPSAGTTNATVTDTQFANNLNGGARFESQNGATITAAVVGTVSSNSGIGLLFRAPAGTINATVNGATLTSNSGYGLVANGTGLSLGVGNSTINANGTGLLVIGGATVTSFADNRGYGNTTNGAFPATAPKQ